MTENNGHDLAEKNPADQLPPQQLALLQQLEAAVKVVIGVTMRGLLSGAGPVPPEHTCKVIATYTGRLMAETFHADLKVQFQLRKAFIEAFTAGVNGAKMNPLPEVPPGQMTSPINLKG